MSLSGVCAVVSPTCASIAVCFVASPSSLRAITFAPSCASRAARGTWARGPAPEAGLLRRQLLRHRAVARHLADQIARLRRVELRQHELVERGAERRDLGGQQEHELPAAARGRRLALAAAIAREQAQLIGQPLQRRGDERPERSDRRLGRARRMITSMCALRDPARELVADRPSRASTISCATTRCPATATRSLRNVARRGPRSRDPPRRRARRCGHCSAPRRSMLRGFPLTLGGSATTPRAC